jgi:glycosyltransferase involved in cell wall biosynthesis
MIRNFLGQQKIKIIHTHGYKSNLYAIASSIRKDVPRISTCHNWLGEGMKMKSYAWLDKFFLNKFDRVIAVSDSVKKEILNYNISPEKVLIINNGIKIERFDEHKWKNNVRKEFGVEESSTVVGTVGRLSEEKGHINLLNAAEVVLRRYPKVVFLIVGDGPLREYLESRASQVAEKIFVKDGCSSKPFIFCGIRSDMPAIYSMMDIFALPSLDEGLPMSLLEAMASKKPVVATKVGAIPKVIEDGHSGVLIQPGDVNGLVNSIIDLLVNPKLAHELGRHARDKVEKEFSSKKMTEKYIDVYHDVLRVH